MEPGTLDGGSRAGVSFGLKGPCGGRLVSVTLEAKSLGVVLGNVNDAKGKVPLGKQGGANASEGHRPSRKISVLFDILSRGKT